MPNVRNGSLHFSHWWKQMFCFLKRLTSNLPSRWKSRASSYCRDFRIFARRRSVVFNKSLSHICLGSLTLTFPRPQLRLFFQCRRSSRSSLKFCVDGAWGQSLDQSAEADGGKYQICATPASEAWERAFSLISSFLAAISKLPRVCGSNMHFSSCASLECSIKTIQNDN